MASYFEKLQPLLTRTGTTSAPSTSEDVYKYWYGDILVYSGYVRGIHNTFDYIPEPFRTKMLEKYLASTKVLEIVSDYLLHEDILYPAGVPYFKNGRPRITFWKDLRNRLATSYLSISPITHRLFMEACRVGFPEDYKHLQRRHGVLHEDKWYMSWEIHTINFLNEDGTVTVKTSIPPFENMELTTSLTYNFSVESTRKTFNLKVDGINRIVFKGEIEWAIADGAIGKCTECGQYVSRRSMMFNICHTCKPVPPNLQLENYSMRATEVFPFKHKEEKAPKYLGLELEYLINKGYSLSECIYVAKDTLSHHAIVKRDGSVDLEICTAPATKEIHYEEFANFFSHKWFNVFKVDNENRNVGMHIHVDKRKMSWLTVGKLLSFMQNDENKEFIHLIGERSSYYATTGGNNRVSEPWVGQRGERYRALNLQPENTVEFRIFATPTTFDQFKKNIEFVDALTTYCSPGNSGAKETHHEDFKGWVQDNRGQYKSLFTFMKGA